MEPIFNAPGTVKGIEVLFFEEAELTKTKGSETCFATFGPLSVLYFPTYNRFILQLNDWRYPILRRNPVAIPEEGSYMLPARHDFFYNLTIKGNPGKSLANLEAIFNATRKLEASPDDKLSRLTTSKTETSTKEGISHSITHTITQTIKQAVQKVQNKASSLKTGTKNLTSTKKKVQVKDIKTKDFRKDAHTRIKKNFFSSNEKMLNEFLQKRRTNKNLSESREFEALKKTSDAVVMYLPKGDVEETILKGKDISRIIQEHEEVAEKPGENITNLDVNAPSLTGNLRVNDARNINAPEIQSRDMPVSAEGMTHYQG